ncbi:uncharacterized protein LOC107819109 [Nicotiana tabacum]|uniref:Mitogen-activated protein kinase kinase kinase 1 n=1 Tax=Nicotiana tabacum TaxID=4097 RepID=A0A1S4CHJ5_TOBAC|nr:PREDICTED: mitogen-activated protein kinase kinase kinase 1-like [Nicotiana tabacum]
MESIGSSSTPSSSSDHHHHHHRPRRRLTPTQPLADRIFRALSHHLRLLHRCDATFFVLGATCNVYTVTLSTTPSCSCPDRTTPCKHILFVLIRVLGVSIDDTCLYRRTLRPCQLQHLLNLPISTEALATEKIRGMFHHLFSQEWRQRTSPIQIKVEDGTTCPVCLEEMNKEEQVAACGTCKNPIHEKCLMAWKRSSRKRFISCVLCRARWKDVRAEEGEKYLNLSVYISGVNEILEENQSRCRD